MSLEYRVENSVVIAFLTYYLKLRTYNSELTAYKGSAPHP